MSLPQKRTETRWEGTKKKKFRDQSEAELNTNTHFIVIASSQLIPVQLVHWRFSRINTDSNSRES